MLAPQRVVGGSSSDAWRAAPAVNAFIQDLQPFVIGLQNRNPDFEDMLRANALTLEKVIAKDHSINWFKSLTRIIQARRYQQEADAAFESASEILLPGSKGEAAA